MNLVSVRVATREDKRSQLLLQMLPWWLRGGGRDREKERARGVPEVGCRRPFQSQAGHVHGGVHQQEENGHNAGDGVELPWEENQLEKKRREGERKTEKREINIRSNKRLLHDIQLTPEKAEYKSQSVGQNV